MLGYLFSVTSFYDIGNSVPMALNSACAFVLLGISLLTVRPERGWMATAISDSIGGVMIRRLLPAAIMVPCLFGWLHMIVERSWGMDPQLGLALFALLNMAVFTAIVLWNGAWMHRTDLRSKQVEHALRASEELGRTIINTVLQVILNVVDFGMGIQEAVSAPRIHHQWLPDRIRVEEGGFSEYTISELQALGHRVEVGDTQGLAHSILIDGRSGDRVAGVDPRKPDAGARGY